MRAELDKIRARLDDLVARLDKIELKERLGPGEAQAFLPIAQKPQSAIESWQTQHAQATDEIARLIQAKQSIQEEARSQIADLDTQLEAQKRATARLEHEKAVQKQELEAIRADLEKAQENSQKLQAELYDKNGKFEQAQTEQARLEKELSDLNRLFQARNKEIEISKAEIELLRKRELPCQAQLLEMQRLLGSLPADLAALAKSRGYNFDNLPAFLTSCGKIENLRQLWEACANQARDGRWLSEAATLLEKLLALFNAGFPENRANLVIAERGGKYRYEEQDRGASNGDRIAEVVLPGMRTSGGTLVKCVVRLN